MILELTTDLLRLVTGSAGNIASTVSWVDANSTTLAPSGAGTETPADITGATTTTVLAAPAASTRRTVTYAIWRNKHATISNLVTVVIERSGPVTKEQHQVTLAPGEALEFTPDLGFFHLKSTAKIDQLLVVTADVTNATTSFADVTGLTIPVKAGHTYCFEASLIFQTNATTTGARFAVNGPASPTYLRLAGLAAVTPSATAEVGSRNTATVSAYDTSVIGAQTTGPGTIDSLAYFSGTIVPSADGTFAIRSQSEVAIASGLIIRRGSWLWIREPDDV